MNKADKRIKIPPIMAVTKRNGEPGFKPLKPKQMTE
jgi:hypothetical protein